MTKYFITGDAGLIDSHLVDRMMGENSGVTVYDDLVSGRREWIEHHLGKENSTSSANLLDLKTLNKAIRGYESS